MKYFNPYTHPLVEKDEVLYQNAKHTVVSVDGAAVVIRAHGGNGLVRRAWRDDLCLVSGIYYRARVKPFFKGLDSSASVDVISEVHRQFQKIISLTSNINMFAVLATSCVHTKLLAYTRKKKKIRWVTSMYFHLIMDNYLGYTNHVCILEQLVRARVQGVHDKLLEYVQSVLRCVTRRLYLEWNQQKCPRVHQLCGLVCSEWFRLINVHSKHQRMRWVAMNHVSITNSIDVAMSIP